MIVRALYRVAIIISRICRAGDITVKFRGVCERTLNLQILREGSLGKAVAANRNREIRPSGMKGGLAETWCMVWRIFATKLETAETMEDADLHMRAPYFYPDRIILGFTVFLVL